MSRIAKSRRAPTQPRRLNLEPLEDRSLLAITVDTLLDVTDDGDGQTSLREAIAEAAAGETIDIAVAGVIRLDDLQGELEIDKDLSIVGPGDELLTIDAGHGLDNLPGTGDGFRVLRVDDQSSSTTRSISLRGLTLAGADLATSESGGAIYSAENLNLVDVTIRDNAAGNDGGGIYSSGQLAINDSTLTGNTAGQRGGGITSASGVLSVTTTTLHDNTAGSNGGALFSESSDTTITSSTLSENYAAVSGGGVFLLDSSAGNSHPSFIYNSTISGNTAGGENASYAAGGVHVFAGQATIRHSTLTSNSAPQGGGFVGGVSSGLFQAQTIVSSSIIAANTAGDVGRGVVNTFVSEGYNLIGFGPATGRFNQPGDQTGVVDPQLAELEDNGGPTLTHRLGIGSPAIDAGDPTAIAGEDVPEFDQRGTPFPRVFDGRIDIGAFEFQPTPPASLVVSTTLDEFDADYSPGDLSLREAINFANLLPGADVIQFDPSLFATQRTISLTLGQLDIETEMTLVGPGADLLTIYGGGHSRIFDISEGDDTQQFDVAISGLTLTGGAATQPGSLRGGAIHSREQLTLSSMVVADNTATLEGGGVYIRAFSPEALRLEGSTFVGNRAEAGGGIAIGSNSFGHVEIVNSTLSGNQSTLPGSGIQSIGGSLFVRLTTVAENEVTGGAGGAIDRAGEAMLLENSIVGNNTDAGGTPDLTGPVQARFSLIEDSGGAIFTGTGVNLIGTDPGLRPLENNGGPTPTHALRFGSPAVDGGDPNFAVPPQDDQRGEPRVVDGTGSGTAVVDMGAYEAQQELADLPLVVDTTVDELDGDYSPGDLSLREAVFLANERVGVDSITFDAGLSGETILLTGGNLELTDGATIDATLLAEPLIIDANQTSGIFLISPTGSAGPPPEVNDFAIAGLTLTGASGLAAIESFTTGTLRVEQSTILNNTGGGGIAANDGTLVVLDSVVTGNQSDESGGGIRSADLKLMNSTVSMNTTSRNGGGISAGSVEVTDSSIYGNSAPRLTNNGDDSPIVSLGGGIYAGFAEVTDSIVRDNEVLGDGGGIRAETLLLTRSLVENNRARDSYAEGVVSNGGGIWAENASIFSSTITGNQSAGTSGTGGGIAGGTITLTDSEVFNNRVQSVRLGQGGGIAGSSVTLLRSTVSGNVSPFAGGIKSNHITLTQSTVSNNNGFYSVGGIRTGSLTLANSTVSENISGGLDPFKTGTPNVGGIVIENGGGSVEIANSILAGNQAFYSLDAEDFYIVNPTSPLSVDFTIIGNTTGTSITPTTGEGNLLDVDPMLGPLADNGGPTQTHALLPGSPAIDMGDLSFDATLFDPPLYSDQRGAPYVRVAGGRVDIGAFELQTTPGDYLAGDYDGNNLVDAADYTVWRDTLGAMVVPFTEADGDGSGVIDEGDYAIWRTNFGQVSSLNTAGLRAATLPFDAPPVETAAEAGATAAQAAIAALEVFYLAPRRTPLAEYLPAPRAAFTDTATDAALLLLARETASESPHEKVRGQADRWARDADGLSTDLLVSSEQGNSNAKPASLGSLEQRPGIT